ncbi:DUF433 domain-containing protein [Laspinema sp. D1]|uniref:DUF433 domain-containing protein n=1 Tax=Laspinema palackyanum D2a TaxID=2953684 RepID=A0ABT2ML59_9CYAN|nr:DUF433 domain-containing protein [Laspinema sp. D2a]
MSNLLERITVNPRQCGGRPCIRGMRIRVSDVLDLFAAGLSSEQILEELPDLEMDDLRDFHKIKSAKLTGHYRRCLQTIYPSCTDFLALCL